MQWPADLTVLLVKKLGRLLAGAPLPGRFPVSFLDEGTPPNDLRPPHVCGASRDMACVARFLRGLLKKNMAVSVLLQEEHTLFKLAVFSGAVSASRRASDPPFSPVYPSGQSSTFELCPLGAISSLPSLSPTSEDGGPWSHWDGVLWGVPKKRTSHSKKRMRMTHKYMKPRHHYTVCPSCNNLKLLHVLCGHCLKETLKQTAAMRRAQLERQVDMRKDVEDSGLNVETSSPSR